MDKRLTSNNKNTPLRNSKFANKPFRSPIDSSAAAVVALTPKNNKNVKLLSRSVDSLKATSQEVTKENQTPKRPHSIDENSLLKRRRIQLEKIGPNGDGDDGLKKAHLSALKRRIMSKKQEIESIKVKLSYRNKHESKELGSEIIKWRNVCHEALLQYQKEWNNNNSEAGYLSDINQVMKQLNIAPDVVKYPDD